MVLIKLLFTDKWWVTQITQVTINMTVYTCMITMMLLMLFCKLAACSSPHSVMTDINHIITKEKRGRKKEVETDAQA